MKATGFVRKIDALGRVTIPIELREKFNFKEKDSVELIIDKGNIVMRRYEPFDMFTGESDDLIDFEGKKISKKTIKKMAELAGIKIEDSGKV